MVVRFCDNFVNSPINTRHLTTMVDNSSQQNGRKLKIV